jgi:Protein of unknown function (DUF1592)/Protein of unknown function (DUF1588)/Protein of unknown function (DUF1595)/Protein of unknown function (DUF1585)
MKKFALLLLFQFGCTGSIASSVGDSARGGDGGDNSGGTGGIDETNGGTGGTLAEVPAGICRVEMPMRRLSDALYRAQIENVFGKNTAGINLFPATDKSLSGSGFSLEPNANAINTLSVTKIYDASEEAALSVVSRIDTLLPCAKTQKDLACAKTFVEKYAPLAFRRPLISNETDELLTVFKAATGTDAFADGIALVVEALIQSPAFLYMLEEGSERADGSVRLTSHEFATRLSFLTVGAPADAMLRAAADNNTLSDPSVLRSHVQRLLDRPEAAAMMATFGREWLHFPTVAPADRASTVFDGEVSSAMQTEFDLFIKDAFLGTSGSVKKLMTSKRTFVNVPLARYYGLPATGTATDYLATDITTQPRSGLLTLPAVMTGLAHKQDTSYVQRGVFVRERILCEDIPTPPANAMNSGPMIPTGATHIERSELTRADRTCGACHGFIDPVGLAFDRFDEVGQYRTRDASGNNIPANGSIVGSDEVDGDFSDIAALGERLGNSVAATRCVATQLFRNAHSRGDTEVDDCFVDEMKNVLTEGGSLRDAVVALATSEAFQFRRLTAGEAQ